MITIYGAPPGNPRMLVCWVCVLKKPGISSIYARVMLSIESDQISGRILSGMLA